MSSTTWTPTAVSSEATRTQLKLWRAVEAQHVVSTRRLVDSEVEQRVLESILEESKPRVPDPCMALDYLLYTPFRYPPGHFGSRFRGVGDEGVFYGAREIRTACAELGFHRVRFLRHSDGLKALNSVAHTLFRARAAGSSIDLRRAPFAADRKIWTDPDVAHYGRCQVFARIARSAPISIIQYESVRDPRPGSCAAVLDCTALAGGGGVIERQTWFLTANETTAAWVRTGERPAAGSSFEFRFRR